MDQKNYKNIRSKSSVGARWVSTLKQPENIANRLGNDGGSIPKRAELVRTQVRQSVNLETQASIKKELWSLCAISGRPLGDRVVSCGLGKLYNKETVLELILDPSTFPEARETVPHISSMKDVQELILHKVQRSDSDSSVFACPITMREMNGTSKFVYIVPCGHTFEATALQNVKEEGCLTCNRPYDSGDVITLNAKDLDLERQRERLQRLKTKGLRHMLAPLKKSKKNKISSKDGLVPGSDANSTTDHLDQKLDVGKIEQKRKRELNDNLKSLYADKDSKRINKTLTSTV